MEQTTTPGSPEVGSTGLSTEQAAEALLTRWQSKQETVDADAGEPEDASADDEERDTEPEQSDEDDADGEADAT
jgi:hypothetical protein